MRDIAYLGRIFALSACLFLPSCASPAPTQIATPEIYQAVSTSQVTSGKARVLYYLGTIDGNLRGMFGPEELSGAADLYANGKFLGGVNAGEIIVFDIAPGNYVFKVRGGSHFEDGAIGETDKIDLKAGETVYLRFDVDQYTRLGSFMDNTFTVIVNVCRENCSVDLAKRKLVTTTDPAAQM